MALKSEKSCRPCKSSTNTFLIDPPKELGKKVIGYVKFEIQISHYNVDESLSESKHEVKYKLICKKEKRL